MKNIYLSLLNNIYAHILSDNDLKIDGTVELLAKAYIPGLNFLKSKPRKIDIMIKHVESKKARLVQNGSQVVIYDRWKNSLPLDMYHFLYSVLRVELLKKQLYSVHAACVGDEEYALIVGHTGVGKTAITLGLLKKGLKIFSGNKTVISFENELCAIAGTTTMTLRSADSKLYAQEIKQMIGYGDRCAFLLKNNRYSTTASVKIKRIFIVRLNDGVSECRKLSPISALHTLYPYFLDVVNADTIMCNGKSIFIGRPPVGAEEYLSKMLSRTLFKLPVYSVTGSKTFVIENVLSK